jgi:hypothetical protein
LTISIDSASETENPDKQAILNPCDSVSGLEVLLPGLDNDVLFLKVGLLIAMDLLYA